MGPRVRILLPLVAGLALLAPAAHAAPTVPTAPTVGHVENSGRGFFGCASRIPGAFQNHSYTFCVAAVQPDATTQQLNVVVQRTCYGSFDGGETRCQNYQVTAVAPVEALMVDTAAHTFDFTIHYVAPDDPPNCPPLFESCLTELSMQGTWQSRLGVTNTPTDGRDGSFLWAMESPSATVGDASITTASFRVGGASAADLAGSGAGWTGPTFAQWAMFPPD